MFSILDLPEKLLQRKIELCKSLIKVYDAIDPGEASQRTNVLFELYCATLVETKAKFKSNLIKRSDANVNTPAFVFKNSISNNYTIFRCKLMTAYRL
jgi:hypothetical protein